MTIDSIVISQQNIEKLKKLATLFEHLHTTCSLGYNPQSTTLFDFDILTRTRRSASECAVEILNILESTNILEALASEA